MNLSKPRNIAALSSITDAQTRSIQRRVVVNGKEEFRRERIPNGQTLKVVKPSGAVVRIPLQNGRASTEMDNPYPRFIQARKPLVGCVPYGRCLQTMPVELADGVLDHRVHGPNFPMVPTELRGKAPCRTGVNGGPISDSNACQCVEALITWRKAHQAARMEAIEIKNAQTKAAEAQTAAATDFASAAKGFAEVVRDMKSDNGSRKGRSGQE